MKVNNHVNKIGGGEWYRCKDVRLQDGMLECALKLDQKYNLTASYKSELHLRFINAENDEDLVAFVRTWGPLYFPNSELPARGVVSVPLQSCRSYQKWLKAFVNLLCAFKWAEHEQKALLEFLEAEYQQMEPSSGEPPTLMLLRNAFHISGSIADWVTGADLRNVRAATDYLVPLVPVHPLLVNLGCRRERSRRYVEAGWTFLSLQEALRWMVWYDEFTEHPIVCCKDCRTVFRVDSGHARKYCKPEHAHRAAAREWQRKHYKPKRRARSARRK